ncbi:FmdB family zinc ribbon protein [Thiolinea disciformis]|uniref:FmdB family zinc ribbon protein n=1 Tax=Thiolinea disciformis TaxID=125614 RepID=UPI00036DB7BF|nr:FmdB family zinc ribbon protein [Thiolinea disciformis]
MPIYAYQCNACGHQLEAIQKISDSPLIECPSCHASALSKQVTAPAFRLGGSGWYETDFKSGEKRNLASNDKDTSPAPACGTGACPACE